MGELTAANAVDKATQVAISSRLGLASYSPKDVITLMRNNKFASALVLLELGELGMSIADELASVDSDVRALLAQSRVVYDDASKIDASGLLKFRDDLEVISFAVARFGSFENYQRIKAALSMPKASDDLYLSLRSVTRGLA